MKKAWSAKTSLHIGSIDPGLSCAKQITLLMFFFKFQMLISCINYFFFGGGGRGGECEKFLHHKSFSHFSAKY